MAGVYRQPPNIPQPFRSVIDAPEPFVAFKPQYRLDVWYTAFDGSPWNGQNKNKANLSDEVFPLPAPPIAWHKWIPPSYPHPQPARYNTLDQQPAPVEVFIYTTPTSRAFFNPPDLSVWRQRYNKANVSAETIYFQPIKYPVVFDGLEWSIWKAQNNHKANLSDEIFPPASRPATWLNQQPPPLFIRLRSAGVILLEEPPLEILVYAHPASRAFFDAFDFTAWHKSNEVNLSDETIPIPQRQTAWLFQQLDPLFTRLWQAGIILPEVVVAIFARDTSVSAVFRDKRILLKRDKRITLTARDKRID